MLKWIYQLGVKAERERIRGLLLQYSNESRNMYDNFRLDDNSTENDKKRLDKRMAVQRTIDRLLEPEMLREYGKSPIDGND